MRKQTKIAALVSAAALLAIGASMTSFANPGWNGPYADGSFEYHDSYDEAVTDEWHTGTSSRDGKTYYYYLDNSGKMAVDQLVDYNGNLYYVNENGERVAEYWYSVSNTEGVTVNEIEPATLYYYFDKKGQAIRDKVSDAIKKSNTNTEETSKFIFDEEGHMMSGWVVSGGNTYYCSGEDEGYVLTGWQKLPIPEEDAEESGDPYEEAKDEAWYYFDGGKMVTGGPKWLAWEGKYSRYYFKSNGQMLEEEWQVVSTPATASTTSYYGDGGSRMSGWVLTKKNPKGGDDLSDAAWYYLSSTGVPFNFNGVVDGSVSAGAVKTLDGKTTYSNVAARIVNNKTYLFDNTGKMLTGIYRVVSAVTIKGSTNTLEYNKLYYFDTEEGGPQGSMVTKKVTKTDEDITYDYYFKKTGIGAENEIVSGVLYGTNGARVNASDSTWETMEVGKITSDKKKSSTQTSTDVLTNCTIIVNGNGRVKDSGTVTIEGVKYYIKSEPSNTVKGYTRLDGVTDAVVGTPYVVVGYVAVD